MVGVPGLLSSELTDIMGTEVGVETCTMSPVNCCLKEAVVAGGNWRGGGGGGGDWGCIGRWWGGGEVQRTRYCQLWTMDWK